jgi:hypothetical protein
MPKWQDLILGLRRRSQEDPVKEEHDLLRSIRDANPRMSVSHRDSGITGAALAGRDREMGRVAAERLRAADRPAVRRLGDGLGPFVRIERGPLNPADTRNAMGYKGLERRWPDGAKSIEGVSDPKRPHQVLILDEDDNIVGFEGVE